MEGDGEFDYRGLLHRDGTVLSAVTLADMKPYDVSKDSACVCVRVRACVCVFEEGASGGSLSLFGLWQPPTFLRVRVGPKNVSGRGVSNG